MNVFNFNNLTKTLEINEPEILLVKEFADLHISIQQQIGKVLTISIPNMIDMMKLLQIQDLLRMSLMIPSLEKLVENIDDFKTPINQLNYQKQLNVQLISLLITLILLWI